MVNQDIRKQRTLAATCPVGSTAIIDADNGQKLSFGRGFGVIYCVGSVVVAVAVAIILTIQITYP